MRSMLKLIMYWESGTQFRIRQQNVSGLTGQKDRPQQTGWTVPLPQNGWQPGGNTSHFTIPGTRRP